MENAQISDIFDEIADLLELREANEFRIRSYRNAAQTVRGLSRRLEDMVADGEDLQKLPNIGESTASKIGEILDTGTCKQLEDLKEDLPEELTEIMHVRGIGPRTAMQLHKGLDIDSVDELKKACEEGRARDLEGLGRKTEEKILKGLKTRESRAGRILLKEAADQVESLGRYLDSLDSLKRWEVAGSYRRRKETVGDLDILVQAGDRDSATEEILEYKDIGEVDSRGEERVTVHLDSGLQVDFRFFDPNAFGAALMYFTGSKAHNIKLRKQAQKKNWKLNEYGLFSGEKLLAGKTEKAVYRRFDLPWIPPELREDRGELKAGSQGELPDLVELDDLRGDLHSHTNRTDGNASIAEMAGAAAEKGYSFLAITDHSKAVSVANGLDEEDLKEHVGNIRKADEDNDDIWLLAGIEVDILKSGKLDLDEDVLADLDWVVASVHSYFDMSEKDMTERIVNAVRSGVVHCLGHPLGRLIGRRDPIKFNVDRVFEACLENDVCLEINCQPERLDLPDNYVKQARDAGVCVAIGTDAHTKQDLELIRYGIDVARRGWLSSDDVVNALTVKQLRKKSQRG